MSEENDYLRQIIKGQAGEIQKLQAYIDKADELLIEERKENKRLKELLEKVDEN